jgi:predicted nucleotidyltransferase
VGIANALAGVRLLPMNRLAEALATIASKYGIRDVYVFGSRAQEVSALLAEGEDAHHLEASGSDLDLAVQPVRGRSLSARELVRLTDELERLFRVTRVDLVVLGLASPLLALEVVKGELLHTSDPLGQAEQELYILRRAADLAPFRLERVRAILDAGAR